MSNQWHEFAVALRSELLPYLVGDSREFIDEWIDDVGEYGLAIRALLINAEKNNVALPENLLEQAELFKTKSPRYAAYWRDRSPQLTSSSS